MLRKSSKCKNGKRNYNSEFVVEKCYTAFIKSSSIYFVSNFKANTFKNVLKTSFNFSSTHRDMVNQRSACLYEVKKPVFCCIRLASVVLSDTSSENAIIKTSRTFLLRFSILKLVFYSVTLLNSSHIKVSLCNVHNSRSLTSFYPSQIRTKNNYPPLEVEAARAIRKQSVTVLRGRLPSVKNLSNSYSHSLYNNIFNNTFLNPLLHDRSIPLLLVIAVRPNPFVTSESLIVRPSEETCKRLKPTSMTFKSQCTPTTVTFEPQSTPKPSNHREYLHKDALILTRIIFTLCIYICLLYLLRKHLQV